MFTLFFLEPFMEFSGAKVVLEEAHTISQQLSKMLFTGRTSTGFGRIKQKLKEWVVVVELEKRYSKNEILSMYLNRFDWINQAGGDNIELQRYISIQPQTT